MTAFAPSSRHHSRDSGRDAVAITRSLVSCRASWIRIEPTPPAPPTTISVRPSPPPWAMRSRSNSSSHAVMAVSGSAAACASESDLGALETMRASTACSSLLAPGRLIEPAYQTRSPTAKPVACAPTASTTPTASQPSTLTSPAAGPLPARTLVSTGLTETACTRTSRSRAPGTGAGNSTSSSALGALMGRFL